MDRKSIIVLVISILLIVFWQKIATTIAPLPPPRTNVVASATNQVTLTNTGTNFTPALVSAGTNQPLPLTQPDAPEELLSLTNKNAIYTFTSHGGGLKLVELLGFREAINCGREVPGERKLASLNTKAPTPALALLGGEGLQGDGVYKLTRTENGLRAEKQLANGLYILKEFVPGTNYLVQAKVRLENRTAAPIGLPQQELVIGTATPLGVAATTAALGFYWYNGEKVEEVASTWFEGGFLGCFGGSSKNEYLTETTSDTNVAWAAVHNQFFTMAAIPAKPAPQLISRRIELVNAKEYLAIDPRAVTNGFQTSFLYPPTVLKENTSRDYELTFYMGPKDYQTLSRLGLQYKNDLDAITGYTGFFGWFAQFLLLCLNWFHALGLHYGLAIIALTIVIKSLFWPLTAASTKSMKRMQLLQPQMKAIQDKYKDDPQKMNMKLMEFMREHKVSPLGGCLPLLLQIPVFIGFYKMLQTAIEIRGVDFLWACDLSQADTIFIIPGLGSLPFVGIPGVGLPINPFAIMMAVTMFLQARLTPVSPGMDPMQQKIMKYMPMMFVVIIYNMSAGLTLYWTVQNLISILQMKLTKAGADPADASKAVAKPGRKKK